jgi:hypothetical protein
MAWKDLSSRVKIALGAVACVATGTVALIGIQKALEAHSRAREPLVEPWAEQFAREYAEAKRQLREQQTEELAG